MRLPFFRSKPQIATSTRADRAGPGVAGDEAALVEAARTRARRRLIGALVLLVVGVVGFPLIFETQPRPLPMDTPILTPSTTTTAARGDVPPATPGRSRRPVAEPVVEPPAENAASEPPPAALPRQAASTVPPTVITERAPAALASAPVAARPASATAAVAVAAAPAVTAAPSAPASGAGGARFVVQVGAFSDAATLREARAKVEKLGLKTYTQVVGSEAGPRTRVRLGPYASRDEADAAAARLKRAGLPANILTL
ncbi:MAG TPA: SPOR domain-containing protein [Rubrivivax sp.]|nr:SPOR domain-containing protein [Rubrivivax sp.]